MGIDGKGSGPQKELSTACDGPIGDSPHTTPTCADTAPGAREHPGAGTNRTSRLAVTRRPGSGNADPEEEKASSQGEEARNEEKEESGAVRAQTFFIGREEDKDKTDGGTEERSPRWPREAEQETPPRFWRSVA
ncbi:hypothetical protein NDU88_000576 [Pleurodeles waltl]|uniref:Uncharacterized protein n=1 Tax=Pleurodeles waltl TaxID=8319 RepID=A0AAV7TFV5_PLEWA|nr:hypothetical protein NDU88_000576 [Pleurodeles waltl]